MIVSFISNEMHFFTINNRDIFKFIYPYLVEARISGGVSYMNAMTINDHHTL